jgi:excinuclease ABC subunit A
MWTTSTDFPPPFQIDQKSTSHNPRSTVGTVTEIYDFMRLLFARAGIPHCPVCGREVVKQSAQEIVDHIEKLPDGTRILILSPLVRGRKGTYQAVFEEIRKAGFTRARVDGAVHSLDDEIELDRYKQHTIEAIVDRLVIQRHEDKEEKKAARTRLTDSVETALEIRRGLSRHQSRRLKGRHPILRASRLPRTRLDRPRGGAAHVFVQHTAGSLPRLSGTRLETGD